MIPTGKFTAETFATHNRTFGCRFMLKANNMVVGVSSGCLNPSAAIYQAVSSAARSRRYRFTELYRIVRKYEKERTAKLRKQQK